MADSTVAPSPEYKWGFVTDIETDSAPKGLDEGTVRFISAKKKEPEWMLEARLKAYRHWLTMKEPTWAAVKYDPIDYQASSYFSAPKKNLNEGKSLNDLDPELLKTFERLGIPLPSKSELVESPSTPFLTASPSGQLTKTCWPSMG